MEIRSVISFRMGWLDQWVKAYDRDPSVETLSLHWTEITSPVGGCKMQRSAGRHQTGLTGVFSNLTIVREGLFFGLLSHYAVMVAIFCLGIWLFLWGKTCQKVCESSIYNMQKLWNYISTVGDFFDDSYSDNYYLDPKWKMCFHTDADILYLRNVWVFMEKNV